MAANRGSTVSQHSRRGADRGLGLCGLQQRQLRRLSAAPVAPRRCGRAFARSSTSSPSRSGGTTVGFLNPALYAIGTGTNYTRLFSRHHHRQQHRHQHAGFFNAVTSYDLCTGLGTPNGTNLINALVPLASSYSIAWTNPAPITYGTALSSVQLNATASVPGSFAYSPTNGAALNTGTNTLSVIFTPADTIDYSSAIGSVSLAVLPAPLIVTAANASRAYGQANPVFTGAITGVTNGDNITATYSCSATAGSPAGTYPIIPSLLDPGNLQTNYQVTLVDGTLTVLQTASVVSWTNPAPITYGTALSSVQLNAAASVPGGFAYSPTNGAVLNTGANTLSVIFTPADTTDYSSAIGSVSLAVLPAPLIVTAANASRVYGQANPVFTGAIAGVTNGDNITATYSCSATAASPAGTYPIIPAWWTPATARPTTR